MRVRNARRRDVAAFEGFLARNGAADATRVKYIRSLQPFMDWLGDRALGSLSLPEINRYLDDWHATFERRCGRRPAPATYRHHLTALKAFYSYLEQFGLRPRFAEPGLPDQPAFHEALGDIVALLSVFSLREVVERLLGDADEQGLIDTTSVDPEALRRSALFGLAEELGAASGGHRGSGLRRSIDLSVSSAWRDEPAFVEPHRRGEVVVAAVMATLLDMWTRRLEALKAGQRVSRTRVAEEGAKAADHLLRMVVRGIDYMPPVELEFEDVLDSVLQADEVVAPDDQHGYRTALGHAFAAFGIERFERRIIDLSEGPGPVYERMNYAALRAEPSEVARFIWENADVFSIDREYWLQVGSVQPSVRVGPDGLVVPEVVAAYVQAIDLTAAELADFGVESAAPLKPDMRLQLWGGGVLVFDQFGRAKYHQTKPLADWSRQARRLDYLVGHGLVDSKHRYGFTISTPRGQRFAGLHVGNRRAGEDW
jgi:Phage integrase, N-terminal SAM-like domain